MEIIAHRGASFQSPENSLEAFLNAIDQGAQRLELDIQVSADNVPFVCHDERTGRVADRDLHIQTTPAATLDTLQLSNGEPLLRFEALCEAISGRAELNVEIKTLTADAATQIMDSMQRHGLLTNGIITSFHPNALHIMQNAGYTGAMGLIVGSDSLSLRQRLYEAWPIRTWREVGASHLVMHHRVSHPLLAWYVRRHGGTLWFWMSMKDEDMPRAQRARAYRRIARRRPDGVIVGRVREAIDVFSAS